MKNKNMTIIIILTIILIFIIPLFGGYGMMGFRNYGMMGGFYSGFGYMPLFGWLLMTLFAAALILFIIWLIKQLGGKK